MTGQYGTALRLTLVEQSRNRFAALLLAVYLPVWYAVIFSLTDHAAVGFRLRAFHLVVAASQQTVGLLTGMLNAATLVMGFVALSAVRGSAAVDRRLVLCGHSRLALLGGRLTAFALVATFVAAYAVGVLALFTPPRHILWVFLATWAAVLAYATVGVLVGAAGAGEVEGLFVIVMLSLVDTFLQNPIANPAATRPIVQFFPTYLPMQMAVAGALTDHVAWWQLAGSLGWAVGLASVGGAAFGVRTRTATPGGRGREGRRLVGSRQAGV